MPNSYVNLVYHLVFSTKERRPWLKEEWRQRIHDYLGGVIKGEGGQPIQIGGVDDHVHVLTRLRQDRAVCDVLQRVKADTTGWIHATFAGLKFFAWQEGYAAFTVSQSNIDGVRSYIRNQAEHHRKRGFQEELADLFEKHGIKPDLRFWAR